MKFLKDIKKKVIELGRIQIICICAISIAFTGFNTLYNYLVLSHHKSMVMTLNYDGAKDGLTPEGGRFDITLIKSDEVLDGVIKRMDKTKLTTDFLRSRISIDAKMPRTAMDKTISSIQSGSAYSYTPSEFTISYSQKEKIGRNDTTKVLDALAESYTEFFNRRYSNNNVILSFNKEETYDGYDYDEICTILDDKVNSMISYLSGQRTENITYISNQTGYAYVDLINKLVNIRDVNIGNLNSYVMQNQVSKDKDILLKKYDYLINKETSNYNYLNNSSNIIKDALSEYNAAITGVAFIPSIDEKSEYYMGRTKTGLDDLVKQSYADGAKAISFKEVIDKYESTYNSFSSSDVSSNEEKETADNMINDIKNTIGDVSEIAIKTDSEYLEIMTNKYLSFKMPPESNFSITYVVKSLIISFIIAFALCKFATIGWAWISEKRKESEVDEI